MVFVVVTPAACAVTAFFVLIGGAIIYWLLSEWIEFDDSSLVVASGAGVLLGCLLGIRAGYKTARDTFPLDDSTSATAQKAA